MIHIGERIRIRRKMLQLSQKELAERIGYDTDNNKSTISKIETGANDITRTKISIFANALETTEAYLMGWTDNPEINDCGIDQNDNIIAIQNSEHIVFPVIGEVAAGYDQVPISEWDGETIPIHIDNLKGRPQSDFFVLEVKGESMFPEFQNGDKVLIQKQDTLEYSGQVGVILYDGEYTTLKKVEFKQGEDWLNLVPINPSYPKERIEGADLERCRVLGFPVLLIREYE